MDIVKIKPVKEIVVKSLSLPFLKNILSLENSIRKGPLMSLTTRNHTRNPSLRKIKNPKPRKETLKMSPATNVAKKDISLSIVKFPRNFRNLT